MLRRLALAAVVVVAFASAGRAQDVKNPQPVTDLSVDDVVARTLAAQGGVEKLKAIQSVKMTGTMTLAGMGDAPVTILVKRPEKVRVNIEIEGTQNAQGYDGQTGWLFLPTRGMKAPEPAPAEMLKDFQEQADIDGPLVDYTAKGNTVELEGKQAVHGTDTYKLKVTTKAGDVRYVYVDAQTFLPRMSESTRMVDGVRRTTTNIFGDYRSVAGLMMPYLNETTVEQVPIPQKLTLKTIDVNVPIDDAVFKMSAAKQ